MLRRRVAVLGLDGASWDLINRMAELGAMPYLKRELEGNSVKGVLESSYPPITPSAWPSITTGVNPGKHGLFDFVRTDPKTGEQRLTTTLDLEHPRIYEMLAMVGIETMVFNPIPPFPLVPLKNLKVASVVFSPRPTHHPEHMQKYSKDFPDYTEYVEAFKGTGSIDKEVFLNLKLEKTYQRVTIVEDALRNENWSLAWIRLQDPDDLFHPAADEAFSGHPKVVKMFGLIDRLIESSRSLADLVVIISDHGFRKYERNVCLNTILFKCGLAMPVNARHQGLGNHDWGWNIKNKPNIKSKSEPGKLLLPSWLTRIVVNHPMPLVTRLGNVALKAAKKTYEAPTIDPITSRAYSPTPYGHGVLVKDIADLEQARKTLLHHQGITNVRLREEVYWGPYVTRAPNLIVMIDREAGYRLGSNRIERTVCSERHMWDHDPHGILALLGEGVHPGQLGLVKSWDVAPTIMKCMGVPLPDDSDGTAREILHGGASEKECFSYTPRWLEAKFSNLR